MPLVFQPGMSSNTRDVTKCCVTGWDTTLWIKYLMIMCVQSPCKCLWVFLRKWCRMFLILIHIFSNSYPTPTPNTCLYFSWPKLSFGKFPYSNSKFFILQIFQTKFEHRYSFKIVLIKRKECTLKYSRPRKLHTYPHNIFKNFLEIASLFYW